jgi:hypothetical protein
MRHQIPSDIVQLPYKLIHDDMDGIYAIINSIDGKVLIANNDKSVVLAFYEEFIK